MDLLPVSSSNLAAVGYSPETRILIVKFKTGAHWQYLDVPPEAHHALMKADSIGSHFCREIKPKFKATKL